MQFRKFLKCLMITLCCLGFSLQAAATQPVRVAMQLAHEGFLMWYAKEQGWDKELGLNLDLHIYNESGADLLVKPQDGPDGWDVVVSGAVSTAIYSHDVPLTVFAMANNESRSTEIFVRADSDILNTRGWNSAYPDVYGSPESIKGKTFLVKEHSCSFLTLIAWLKIFGLSINDIKYQNVTPSEAIKGMFNGSAEGLVVWSPNSYDALRLGYEHVANAEDVHVFVPNLFSAHKDYARTHTAELSKLIVMYERACDEQIKHKSEMIKAYEQFLKQYTGRNYDERFASFDLRRHRVFSLDEQLTYFAENEGNSKIADVKSQILQHYRELTKEIQLLDTYEVTNFQAMSSDQYLKHAIELIRH
ncbi:MAG: ABC transporter substrate-binding protein [Succinivibrio sp.]|nr:ABC transporter substrate-binding protein [Succinivibrio sp.]